MRQGRKIVEAIEKEGGVPRLWIEPFSGALGSGAAAMRRFPKAKFVFLDNNEALQNMWKAALNGWEPPSHYLTREDYISFKERQDVEDPMTAFVGFGYSFGGKWFAGYAKCNENVPGGRDLGPAGSTIRKIGLLRERDVDILTGPWDGISSAYATVYYDPPYSGKTRQRKGVVDIDPRSIEHHAKTAMGGYCYATEFGEVFKGRVILNMGNTDMLVNGGHKRNLDEMLVKL